MYFHFSALSGNLTTLQQVKEGTVVDLRRTPEGAMALPREEKAINKAHKLLLEDAKIIDYCLFNPTIKGI